MKLASKRWIAALLTTLLQSCGGGGGGGDGGNPAPGPGGQARLTQVNAIQAGILTFGPPETSMQAMQILSSAADLLHQQLLVPQQFACTGAGFVRLTVSDNDHNATLSNGDRVVTTYSACDGTDGTLQLTITQVAFTSGVISTLNGAVAINLRFTEFPAPTLTGSGQLEYRATSSQLRWLGTNFAITLRASGQTEAMSGGRIEKTVTVPGFNYSVTISGTINSDALGGRFTFATSQPFGGIDEVWPTIGVVTATGASSSRIEFSAVAIPGLAQYQVDADGNGQYDTGVYVISWTDIASGPLFGIYDDTPGPGDPPPDPTVEALGRRVALGAAAGDLQVDDARAKIYVSLPDRNELAVINAQTLAVERRVLVGSQPGGMSMSLNGEELFIGLGAAGSIAIVDLDTFAVSQVFVASAMTSSFVYDVVETSPGILFISSGTTFGSGARLDRSTGEVTPVNAMREGFMKIELLADPARGVLYAGDGWGIFPQNINKIDATNPLAPVVLRSSHGTIQGTNRLSLDPAGTRIYLYGGEVLSTTDFSEIAELAHGVPWALDNGMDVMVADGTGTLHIYSAQNLREVDVLESDCGLTFVDRLAPSPVDGQWLMVENATLCVIDVNNPLQRPGTGQPGVPANPPPALQVSVIDMMLGADVYDAEFDAARNRVYVSLPSTGEVVTVDAATRQIVERDALGNAPRGLDLSPDGSTLAIIFNANGHIGYKDLLSGQTTTTDLTSFLQSPQGNDVAYVSDDAIFASTNSLGGPGYIVKTSRLNFADTRRVANEFSISDRAELAASPDGRFLYASASVTELFKLDLGLPDAPIVLRQPQGTLVGTDRLSVSPNGDHIATRFRFVVRTSNFTQAGQISVGVPLYSRNGANIFVASDPGRIDRFDSASYVNTQQIQGNCSISDNRRLLANADESVLMTAGQSRLCFWFLSGPAASSVKIGPHSPYVCDTDCVVRQYQRRMGRTAFEWQRR